MPRLQGYRDRRWWKFYDTTDLAKPDGSSSWKGTGGNRHGMFGTANLGNFSRTNLSGCGSIPDEASFVILGLYAVTPIDDRISAARVDFFIGNQPALPTMTLREWLMGFRPAKPLLIPIRQNFHASVDWDDAELFKKEGAAEVPFDIALHIEGLLTKDIPV